MIVLLYLLPACAGAQTAVPAGREKLYLRTIHVIGTQRTRQSILLREMSVHAGDSMPADSVTHIVQQNRLRLLNIALFTEVNVHPEPVAADSIDLYVIVKERWYIWPQVAFQLADRNFNVWWTEQNRDLRRANIGLTVKDKNFRGNYETLSATAQVGYTQRFAIEYSRPYIDRRQKHGIGLSLSLARSQEMAYTTDSNKLKFARSNDRFIYHQADVSVVYSYRPGYAARHVFQLSYRNYRIDDTIVGLNHDYYRNGSNDLRMLEFTYRFDLNHVDNWNYPLTGFKLVSYTTLRAGIDGIGFQASETAEAGWFRQPAHKWYTGLIFRGRLSLPYDQPYAFRQALGTRTDYVRGYEYYVVDGAHYGVLRADLKRELYNHIFEKTGIHYLPSVPLRIYPKLFMDLGYAVNKYPGNSFLNDRLLYAAGIGLDIVTAYDLKIRLEYAWNHLGQNGLFLHFNSE